jgi:hypothetical protein
VVLHGPLEVVNLVYIRKLFRSAVHFDRILTESGIWATNFGAIPAGGVTPPFPPSREQPVTYGAACPSWCVGVRGAGMQWGVRGVVVGIWVRVRGVVVGIWVRVRGVVVGIWVGVGVRGEGSSKFGFPTGPLPANPSFT